MSVPLNSQQNPLNNDQIDNDLQDLLETLQHKVFPFWRSIISLILLLGFIGFILASLVPKQWEATATLRIGRIPLDTVGQKLIEDPIQTSERVKLVSFKKQLLTKLGLPITIEENKRSALFFNTLKANATQNTEFVNLSVRGYSTNDAIRSLSAVVKEIQITHALLTKPLKSQTQKESLIVGVNLARTSQEISDLKRKMQDLNQSNSSFAPNIVAINLLASKETEEHSLQIQQIQNYTRLAAFDEQTTALVSPIDVSIQPIFPKQSTFIIIGSIVGLLVGIFISILRYNRELGN